MAFLVIPLAQKSLQNKNRNSELQDKRYKIPHTNLEQNTTEYDRQIHEKLQCVESQTILEESTILLLAFAYAFQNFPAGKGLINFVEFQINTRPVLRIVAYLEKK